MRFELIPPDNTIGVLRRDGNAAVRRNNRVRGKSDKPVDRSDEDSRGDGSRSLPESLAKKKPEAAARPDPPHEDAGKYHRANRVRNARSGSGGELLLRVAALSLTLAFCVGIVRRLRNFPFGKVFGTGAKPGNLLRKVIGTGARPAKPKGAENDLPKFKELPSLEGDPYTAWEIAPLRYPGRGNATLCACDKCGTNSLYAALYEITHRRKWTHDGPPWIQALDHAAWWTAVRAGRKEDWTDFGGESFALVRDPKERLLSAWKSNIQCRPEERDEGEVGKFIYPLLELAGMDGMTIQGRTNEGGGINGKPWWDPCLDVSTFLLVMLNIHSQGKQGLVDGHFRPQHLWCFLHAPPEKWTHVVTAGAPDGACRLESVVMGKDSHTREGNCAMQKLHATKDISAYATLTDTDRMILDVITREEYKVLGPYL